MRTAVTSKAAKKKKSCKNYIRKSYLKMYTMIILMTGNMSIPTP